MPDVPRCSAQAWAPAASSSLHMSSGTPTALRSLLCTARISVAKSAVFPILLLKVDSLGNVLLAVDGVEDPSLLSVDPLAYIVGG
ncbi:MAG TPA: hypothetical protein VLR10_04815, partial [Nitrososphaeraceae archaeon]|nr:hypothetical protein [Nitrososphaeraceae archaeon]